MEAITDQTFDDVTVEFDDKNFTRCKLRNCEIFYYGGQFRWNESQATNCRITLFGNAADTAVFLQVFGLASLGDRWKAVKLIFSHSDSEEGTGAIH